MCTTNPKNEPAFKLLVQVNTVMPNARISETVTDTGRFLGTGTYR
jgi:hypothetical protein